MRKRKQSKKRKKSSGCVDGRQRKGEEEGRKKNRERKNISLFMIKATSVQKTKLHNSISELPSETSLKENQNRRE